MMRTAILGLLLLAGCATPVPPAMPLTGKWGGRHVGLELDPAGGRLDYDCAAGRIEGPVMPGAGGRFQAHGTHTPGTGGPELVVAPRPSLRAHYEGTVRGDGMTLTVTTENGMLVGPFELRRGAEPILLRCL